MRRSPLLALALLSLTASGATHAQGIYADRERPVVRPPDVPPPVIAPRPTPPSAPTRLVLTRQRIQATISELIASYRVEQEFRNPSDVVMEGVYLFPVPKDAVARGVNLWINGTEVAGEVLDANQARDIYRDIVRTMRDPALLEYADHGLVRASIFPIPARGTVQVALRFSATTAPLGGVHTLTLPLRFAADAGAAVVLDATIETARPLQTIYSPTHALDVARDGAHKARVSYEGTPTGTRDLLLYFSTEDAALGVSLIAHRLPANPGTFALVLTPQDPRGQAAATPRDVVFALDRSGSMSGEKWTQAQNALRFGLSTLNPQDRFALVSFATDVRVYKDGLLPAVAEEVAGAKAHLDALQPAGGTQISGALDAAFALLGADQRRLQLVTFLTDGLPTIGEVDADRIIARSNAHAPHARVFAFGIGHDVNTFLLDRLAADHGGASDYVRAGEDLEIPVSAFFAKIQEPVLVAPRLHFEGIEVFDAYPQRLPDLFAGAPLVVFGRFAGDGPAALTLTGRTFGGEQRALRVELVFPREQRTGDALPALWAARKVGFLLDEIRLHGTRQELVDAVIALGREFGIVTPYTAGLVVEEGMALGATSGVLRRRGLTEPAPAPGAAERSARDQLSDLDQAAGARAERLAKSAGPGAVTQSLEIKRLMDHAAADDARHAGRSAGGAAVERFQLAGRTLVRIAGSVIDAAFRADMEPDMTEVSAFSDAWFDLVQQDPALRAVFALSPDVIVVVDGRAIRVVP